MNLVMGNLTVAKFAERVGAVFTEAEMAELEERRVDNASAGDPHGFHIFDDPAIQIHIGAEAFAEIGPIFVRANERQQFNREVSFFQWRAGGSGVE